jgi:hypothetical protein
MAARGGMGGLGIVSGPASSFPAGSLPDWGMPTTTSTTGHSTRDAILGIANQGLALVANIFGNKNQPQYVQPGGYTPNGGAPGSAVATGVQSTLDSFAAQFGVSSTTLLIMGGLGLYLLMKPSPSQRR